MDTMFIFFVSLNKPTPFRMTKKRSNCVRSVTILEQECSYIIKTIVVKKSEFFCSGLYDSVCVVKDLNMISILLCI